MPQTQIPYIFATRCRRPFIFPTNNSVRLDILSFKYQRFTPSCGKDIEIRKFYFLAKTQFLSEKYCLFVEFDKIIVRIRPSWRVWLVTAMYLLVMDQPLMQLWSRIQNYSRRLFTGNLYFKQFKLYKDCLALERYKYQPYCLN